MALTQLDRDLHRYAQQKMYKLILDVVQTFDIAGRPRSEAIASIGSVLLRLASTLAVWSGADRERWLMMCNEVYEIAQQAKREDDDDGN